MKSKIKPALFVLIAVFVLIQFVPSGRSNPEVNGDFNENAEMKVLFKRACFDCHSNETVWPWYSKVAPVSWWIADHVKDGRKHLNFSSWTELNPKRRHHKMEEIWEQVEKGEMPLESYLLLHKAAKLSEAEKEKIHTWFLTDSTSINNENE